MGTFGANHHPFKSILGDSTWNINTGSEYTYDPAKIEFPGGVAQLKAAGTSGTTWITDEGGASWKYRRSLTIDITGNPSLANGYAVHGSITGDTASAIYSLSLASGNDFRIGYWNEATTADVMRDLISFTSSSIDFYFKTQAELAGNDTTHYFVYYGNTSASAPTVDKTQIYNNTTNAALSASGGTATASDTYSGTQVTWMNDGFADGSHGGWGNNNVAASRAMIKLPAARKIWKTAQYWGGNDAGGWGKPQGTYFPTSYQAQYTTDNTAVASDVVGSAKWTSLSNTANGLTVSRTATTDYSPTYPNNPSVSGTTVTSGLQSCTNCFGTTVTNTLNPVSALSVRFAYTNTAWLGSMGEFFVYPINATEATADPTLSVGSQTTLYPTDNPILVPNTGQGYSTVSAFAETLGVGSTGNLKYQVSPDDGATWYWYTAGAWTATVAGYTETNTAADINTHFADVSFDAVGSAPKTFKWRAYFSSDGGQQPKLDNLVVTYVWDTADPDNPAALATAKSQAAGGTDITTDTWYNYPLPYFTWAAPNDNANPGETISGIAGYYVYFGTTATADPHASGIYQTGLTYTASSLVSGSTYYLRLETKDNAGNIHDIAAEDPSLFIYKYDSTAPTSPTYVSVSPSGYTRTNSFTFSWPVAGENAAVDTGGSGLVGYNYKINTGAWSGNFNDGSVALTDIASTGVNIFYLRAVDAAGNYDLTPVQTNFYYNASAPTAPQNLAVTPATNSVNSFAFSWDLPLTYSGSIDGYYYSINALPTLANTTYTTGTSLAADAYATQQGVNTFYIVAKDESGNYDFASCSSISGNPAVDSCAKVDFSADTAAPGRPTAVEIFDISNRDTQEYAITLKWTAPTSLGAGFAGYEVYRSTNGSSFDSIGTTSGTTYADTDLSSRVYYYYIRSKDNAGQYSAASETVSITPTGKWTTPPNLVAQPKITVGSFTAAITWQTDREGSSFVEYGLDPQKIGTANGGETKGQLDDVMDHSVSLKGLQANTTYYYRAVWVDTDGNQGTSGTLTFTTKPAPKVSEVDSQSNITLNSILVNWSTTVTANCYINYGETTAYGGILRETAGAFASAHSMNILALEHSTTYHFQISCLDTESNLFSSDDYKEATLTMPQISEFRYETVAEAPSTTLRFSWKTNVATTSIVSYTPSGAQAQTQSKADYETEHNLTASDLQDKTTYSLQAKGVDRHGNTAQSDNANFTTPDDTRPPKISELTVEVKSSGFGTAQKSQVVVGWQTDEPGSSQVEYAQGISGQEYNFKTKEDSNLATSHVVIIPDLDPSKIYHLRTVSRDKANNLGASADTTVITGKEQKGILDIIINSLSASLGWLFKIFQR